MNTARQHQGISYFIKGDSGTWVIMLHGFCERSSLWKPIESFLPSNFRYLFIDLPGFGASTAIIADSIVKMADEIKMILKFLQIDEAIFIGHSMGGYVSLKLAKESGSLVKALGLVHSTVAADNEEKKSNRLKTISFLERNPLNAFLKVFVEGLFDPRNLTKKELIIEANELVSNNTVDGVTAGLKAMMNRLDSYDWLSETTIPMMILAGRNDGLIAIDKSIHEASLCRRGMIHVLENSGHLGMFEETELCGKYLNEFILWADRQQPEQALQN
jgi:pimeloyl-ACP methyl ester carboxylesterase